MNDLKPGTKVYWLEHNKTTISFGTIAAARSGFPAVPILMSDNGDQILIDGTRKILFSSESEAEREALTKTSHKISRCKNRIHELECETMRFRDHLKETEIVYNLLMERLNSVETREVE